MKQLKILFVVCLLAAFVMPQNVKADTKIGGIRAGYQSSAFFSDGDMVGNSLDAFYIGFYRDNKIIPLLHITSGLEYFQLGNDYGVGEYKIHTLSIPVSAKVKVGPVYGLAGISANFKLSTSGDGGFSDPTFFDYPLHLGVGVNILMIGVEARYHWGMNDTFKTGSIKTNYLQIGATIAF